MPPLADVAKLTLQQGQGGPRLVKCGGVISRLTADLTTNTWTYGVCVPPASQQAASDASLTTRRGSFTPAQRAHLEALYSALTVATATGCGHDGGTLSLTLERKGGAVARYVDQNWGCRTPAPETVVALRDFATAVMPLIESPTK